MERDFVQVRVTELAASVREGVPIEWQGRTFSSGSLTIELDNAEASVGVLDYSSRRACVDFHVRLGFPEFAALLEGMGVDSALTQPVRALLHSEGEILDDHGFALSGACAVRPHGLFTGQKTAAAVLPGH